MQFQKLSDEQVAELKRPRPVTAEQLKDLKKAVERNYENYLESIEKKGVLETEKYLLEEAAAEVAENHLKRLDEEYERTGRAVLWLCEEVKFKADCSYKRKEILGDVKKNIGMSRVGRGKEVSQVSLGEMDSSGAWQGISAADMWHLTESRRSSAEDQAIAALPSLAAILLPRILEVLGSRSGHGSLSADQVEAVQVLLAVAVPEMPAPEHIKKLLESFQCDLKEWRTDLARVRMAREQNPPLPDPDLRTHFPKPTGQSKVTGDINHSRGKILLCLYLFVTLAPVDSAVTRTGDMNDLLDAVFGPRKDLPTHYRRLLQKAGACLENVKSTYRVDTDELHSRCRTDNRFKTLTPDELIGMLHSAEDRYARLVPGQRCRPPRFACVLRCRTHHPE